MRACKLVQLSWNQGRPRGEKFEGGDESVSVGWKLVRESRNGRNKFRRQCRSRFQNGEGPHPLFSQE